MRRLSNIVRVVLDAIAFARNLVRSKEAALLPKLHKELWEKWGADLPSDPSVRHYLVTDRGFNEKTVGDFIAEYKATLDFAELINNGKLANGGRGEKENETASSSGSAALFRQISQAPKAQESHAAPTARPRMNQARLGALAARRDGSRYAQDSPRERDHASDRGVDLAAVPRSDTVRARTSLCDRRPRYQVLRRFTEVRASDGRQGVEDAPFSRQANCYCERLLGTTRRECLDFLVPLSEKHLRRLLCEWRDDYNQARPHSSLGPNVPEPAGDLPVDPASPRHSIPNGFRVVSLPILGALHHDYRLARAA